MRGAGRPAPLALDLTLAEFVFGYATMLEAPTLEPAIRAHMLRFLKLLMEDANIRPWQQVRHFHMVIIQAMETGQLQWGEMDRILELQRQHSRSGMVPSQGPPPDALPPLAARRMASLLPCTVLYSKAMLVSALVTTNLQGDSYTTSVHSV
jgi:hypothetical protein